MPRPLHPGRHTAAAQVIPDGWSAQHAGVVAQTMDCTVTIGPAGGAPAFDSATRVSTAPAAAAVYAGPASVLRASVGSSGDDRRVEAADDQVDIRAYVVKIPAGQGDGVEPDHVIHVTGSPRGELDGTTLLVTGVAHPAREFSRVISARVFQ